MVLKGQLSSAWTLCHHYVIIIIWDMELGNDLTVHYRMVKSCGIVLNAGNGLIAWNRLCGGEPSPVVTRRFLCAVLVRRSN